MRTLKIPTLHPPSTFQSSWALFVSTLICIFAYTYPTVFCILQDDQIYNLEALEIRIVKIKGQDTLLSCQITMIAFCWFFRKRSKIISTALEGDQGGLQDSRVFCKGNPPVLSRLGMRRREYVSPFRQ